MKAARAALILLGVGTVVGGAVQLLTTQRTDQIVGVAIWILGVIVVHDAVLSPIVLFVSLAMRRAGKRVPWAVLGLIEVALVIGAVVSLFVVPELFAQAKSPANPTILTGDYGLRLVVLWVTLIVVAAAGSMVYLLRNRQKVRESTSQT
ncbi:hypothetical protein ACFSBZ_07960 [Amnibacterium flavum]|uniref:Uncharacterized protein n=1 Tax=Amnibacterium flavum TaxID=2173173 RepID=A0A2V1HT09_9MICO|nr:hypothetical protein [Amnibacterium flavum]PVZ93457.1 hypothetical protein DDQ50_15965 [Amnibacterium flavum]